MFISLYLINDFSPILSFDGDLKIDFSGDSFEISL